MIKSNLDQLFTGRVIGNIGLYGDAPPAALARQAGAKKITELKVSAPFHCELLSPVEERLERELAQIEMQPAAVPIVLNVSAAFESEPSRIKASLVKQVSTTILWEQSMNNLINAGFDTFIELGPGRTLSKLMKRIDGSVYAASVDDGASLEAVLEHLKGAVS